MSTTPTTTAVSVAAASVQVHKARPDQEAEAIHKARTARARIKATTFDAEGHYRETLVNVRQAINHLYPSEAQFCEAVGIDKHYLSKCWPVHGRPLGREMGVGMFTRICLALGRLSNEEVTDEQLLMRESWLTYLKVNNNALLRASLDLRAGAE